MNFSIKTLLIAICCATASAFAPQPQTTSSRLSTTSLAAYEPQKMAASLLLGAFVLSNVASVAPSVAFDPDFGTTELLAARSGGRASRMSAPPPRIIERQTTVIHSSPAYVAPAAPVFLAPAPVYNPMPGLGLGLGLSAINDVGNAMRDYRQETEIQQSKAELQQARIKEAELEARLRNLEMMQMQK
jgi:hypothetical protein